jgi:hypothetical protein
LPPQPEPAQRQIEEYQGPQVEQTPLSLRGTRISEGIARLGFVPDRGHELLAETARPLQMDSPESFGGQRITYDEATGLERAGDQLRSGWETFKQGLSLTSAKSMMEALALADRADGGATPAEAPLWAELSPDQRQGLRDRTERALGGAIQSFIKSRADQQEFLRNPNVQALAEAVDSGRYRDAWRILSSDFGGIVQEASVQSLPNQILPLAGALAGGLGAGALGVRLGAFGGGYVADVGPRFVESLSERMAVAGVNGEDPAAVQAWMSGNMNVVREEFQAAQRAAYAPALADVASFGLARGLRPGAGVLRNTGIALRNMGIEIGTEGVGEAGAGILGQGKVTPSEVLMEMLGAGPQAVGTTAIATLQEARNMGRTGAQAIEPVPNMTTAGAPSLPPAVEAQPGAQPERGIDRFLGEADFTGLAQPVPGSAGGTGAAAVPPAAPPSGEPSPPPGAAGPLGTPPGGAAVPTVLPNNTRPSLEEALNTPTPTPEQQAEQAAQEEAQSEADRAAGVQRIADSLPPGWTVDDEDQIIQVYDPNGMPVTQLMRPPATEQDFTALMTGIEAQNQEGVVGGYYPQPNQAPPAPEAPLSAPAAPQAAPTPPQSEAPSQPAPELPEPPTTPAPAQDALTRRIETAARRLNITLAPGDVAAVQGYMAEEGLSVDAALRRVAQEAEAPPAPTPSQAPVEQQPAAPTDQRFAMRVSTPTGSVSIEARPEVVDASTLIAATGDLQNRDRQDRDESERWIARTASILDPAKLMLGPESDRGAPIVNTDNIVESGNGRVAAIVRAFEQHPEKARAYVAAMEAAGYDTGGMKMPVLIRRRVSDLTADQLRRFVVDSNRDDKMRLGPVEQARQDAKVLTDDMLALLKPDLTGGLLAAGNQGFVQRFMSAAVSDEEMNTVVDDKGNLSPEGERRITGAILARAYADRNLLSRALERTDDDSRAITSGLVGAAPAWVSLRAAIERGEIQAEFDITKTLIRAADLIRRARDTGQTPAAIIKTADMLNPVSPLDAEAVRLLTAGGAEKVASATRISARLREYVAQARTQTTDKDLVGGKRKLTPEDAMRQARDGRQGSLLGGGPAPQEAARPGPEAPQDDPAAPEGNEAAGNVGPLVTLARKIAVLLAEGTPLFIGQLMAMGREAFGASAAEGGFDRKQLYDAIELAVNMRVLADGRLRMPMDGDIEGADAVLDRLDRLKNTLPTQTVRTQEQIDFQQFSTPPDYAALAAYVANVRPGDVVLEPSAGTGSLLSAAYGPGVTLIGNELAPRRAETLRGLLTEIDGGQVFTEDAEQIHRILPGRGVQPTLVVMNPPFSRAGNRAAGKRILDTGARHINTALALLPDGGRLVAIVGRGMSMDAPAFREWWATILRSNLVRANIPIGGAVYAKYGTTFATRLLVIDKGRLGGAISQPIAPQSDVSLSDALQLLKEIRDGRPIPEGRETNSAPDTPEQPTSQPGGAGSPSGTQSPPGPVSPAPSNAAGGGAGTAGPRPGRPGSGVGGNAGPTVSPSGSKPGGSLPVVDQQPAPNTGGTGGQPDGGAAPSGGANQGNVGVSGNNAGPAPGAGQDLDSLFDDVLNEEFGAPPPPSGPAGESAAATPTLRPAGEVAASAVTNTVRGIGDIAASLESILLPKGDGKISSNPLFDPEQYARVLPMLREAAQHFREAWGDVKELMRQAVRALTEAIPAERRRQFAEALRPYITRFASDVQSGAVNLDEQQQQTETPPEQQAEEPGDVYEIYKPARLTIPGAKPHPGALVQSAAMASVMPPPATYRPNLADSVIRGGQLSEAQIEAVTYAGQAHAKILPAAAGEWPRRRGFFIGDGTGVGKGREIAGIILDNWNQGRTKAVWVSEKAPLLKAAQRDWKGIGQDPNVVFDLKGTPPDKGVGASRGILFTTYDTLRSGLKNQQAAATGKLSKGSRVKRVEDGRTGTTIGPPFGKLRNEAVKVRWDGEKISEEVYTAKLEVLTKAAAAKTRVDQIVEWLGADFDGVIAFDEAHNMANAIATKGKRGLKDVSEKALAGVELQARLPNARVVYVSATGATEVSNLAYADRLGLWGYGTPFADRTKFLAEIESGGVAAMELVARDMKSLGLYLARNLSFNGVEYGRLEHELTEAQREIYDTLANIWQKILGNIDAALEITEAKRNKNAVSAARSAFWGTQQRFFLQIISAMKMPSVIRAIREDINAGRQVVIQLTQTNEADTERAASKLTEGMSLEDLDITPREQVASMLMRSFPVQAYEVRVDPQTGQKYSVPVVDAQGNPVLDPEAVALRDNMIRELATIRMPDGPLDQILNTFGVDEVAEVTGRGRRFVYREDPVTGEKRRVEERRPASANIAEADAFNAGEKRVLVFSDAGGTGRDYHAGNQFKSKDRRRVHYVLQPGWRADKAVQGLGRSHRTDQASAPMVRLTATTLGGEKRFISTIARRLAQLGALTKGQRQAGESGIFSSADNLEGDVARDALRVFWGDVMQGLVPALSVDAAKDKLGLDLQNMGGGFRATLPEIETFLNRIMVLPVDEQNAVFENFMRRMEGQIRARQDLGTLDVGLETIKANSIVKAEDRVIYTQPETSAETRYVRLTLRDRPRPDTLEGAKNSSWYGPPMGFVRSPANRVYALLPGPDKTMTDGAVEKTYLLSGPMTRRVVARDKLSFARRTDGKPPWQRIEEAEAARAWRAEVDALPEFIETPEHLITGALLPVWDRLTKGSIRVVRVETDTGERLIGRTVDRRVIGEVLRNFGVTGEDTEAAALPSTPEQMMAALRRGVELRLANDWAIRRVLVGGEMRFELVGPSGPSEARAIELEGVFSEIMGFKARYFVPTGNDAATAAVLRTLTARRPVVAVAEGRGQAQAAGGAEDADDSGSLYANPFDPALFMRLFGRPAGRAVRAAAAGMRERNVAAVKANWAKTRLPDGVEVDDPARLRDLTPFLSVLRRPSRMFRKWPAVAALVDQGIAAERRMNNWQTRMDKRVELTLRTLEKQKGDRAKVTAALFDADANEVDIAKKDVADKHFAAHDLSPAEATAARELNAVVRMNARLVDNHRRAMMPKVRKRKAEIWVAMTSIMDRASVKSPEYKKLYARRGRLNAKIRHNTGDLAAHAAEIESINAQLRMMRAADPTIQERMAELQTEYDALESRLANTSVQRRPGYFPHKFFGSWRMFKMEGVDEETGEQIRTEITSDQGFYDTEEQAIEAARAYLKANPDAKLRIERKVSMMPSGAGGAVLSDAEYFRLRRGLENATGIEGQALNDALSGVARRRSGRRVFTAAMFRTGAEGFSQDLQRVLKTHNSQSVRYVEMDKLKFAYVATTERLGLSPSRARAMEMEGKAELFRALESWWNDVNGNKQQSEEAVDGLLHKMGLPGSTLAAFAGGAAVMGASNPILATAFGGYLGWRMYGAIRKGGDFPTRTLMGDLTSDMAHLKLGMLVNIASSVVNLSQTLINTYPVLGEKWTAIGVKRAALAMKSQMENRDKPGLMSQDAILLRRADVMTDISIQADAAPLLAEDAGFVKSLKRVSMAPFMAAEHFNRATAFLGALARAEAKGLSPAAAFQEAQEVLKKTQFHQGIADRPELLRVTVLKLPTQFKNFMIQQLGFAFDLAVDWRKNPAPIARFLLGLFLAAGLIGILPLALADWLLDYAFGVSPIRWMKDRAIRAEITGEMSGTMADFLMRGLPTLLQMDLSGRVGMGQGFIPNSPADLMQGPFIGTAGRLKELASNNRQEIVDYLAAISPAANPLRMLEAAANGATIDSAAFWSGRNFFDGRTLSRNPQMRGMPEYNMTNTELTMQGAGFRPLRSSLIADDREIARANRKEGRKDVNAYLQEMVQAERNGRPERIAEIRQEAAQNGVRIPPQRVRDALRDARRDRPERELRSAPRDMRPEMRERLRGIDSRDLGPPLAR